LLAEPAIGPDETGRELFAAIDGGTGMLTEPVPCRTMGGIATTGGAD